MYNRVQNSHACSFALFSIVFLFNLNATHINPKKMQCPPYPTICSFICFFITIKINQPQWNRKIAKPTKNTHWLTVPAILNMFKTPLNKNHIYFTQKLNWAPPCPPASSFLKQLYLAFRSYPRSYDIFALATAFGFCFAFTNWKSDANFSLVKIKNNINTLNTKRGHLNTNFFFNSMKCKIKLK